MAFCITFGTHDFRGPLAGYENVNAQCHNCGNWSAHVMTEWPFFTICFVPLIPMAFHKYQLVACPICNFKEDLVNRPDVQSQGNAGGGGGGGGGGGPPPGQMPPQQGAPPQAPQQGYQQYYQQPQPQYK